MADRNKLQFHKEIFMLSGLQRRTMLLAGLLAAAPIFGFSSTVTGIEASGSVPTICGYGSCTPGTLSTGALNIGGSTAGSYNFEVTAGDGDIYNVSGTFNNTFFSGTFLGFFPTVTLLSTSAAGADTITLDMFQDFFYGTDAGTSWAGPYNEILPLDLSATGTTATGQVLYSTDLDTTPQSVGVLPTVNGPGAYFLSGNGTLDPLDGDLLIGDFQFTFTFPDGALQGTSISSPVPEPSQTIPVAIGLMGLILFKLRRRVRITKSPVY
jgi:hypothetical protein